MRTIEHCHLVERHAFVTQFQNARRYESRLLFGIAQWH